MVNQSQGTVLIARRPSCRKRTIAKMMTFEHSD